MAGFLDRVKENWKSNIDYYKKVYGREKPLPSWTDADVEEFIKSDPVYGPQMRLIKDGKKFIGVGGVLGAVHLAGTSWKYSKSPHGTVLAGLFGGFCGMTFGKEVAGHWYQLYKYKPGEAQLRFLYWWEDKTAGQWSLALCSRVNTNSLFMLKYYIRFDNVELYMIIFSMYDLINF